jgi:hypothetical protein
MRTTDNAILGDAHAAADLSRGMPRVPMLAQLRVLFGAPEMTGGH